MAKFPEDTHPLKHGLNLSILAIARTRSQHVYLVGGYVRDAFLSKAHNRASVNAKDLDYAVSGGTAFDLAKAVAAKLNGHYVPLDEDHDTARVVLPDATIVDFAGCVGGNIENDVLRRDFTVNALVWDPQNPDEVLDLVGGLKDLEQLTLRAVSEAVLIEDPLRLLRAFRFSAIMGGAIESETLKWIKKHTVKLSSIPAERINSELFALFAEKEAESVVRALAETGLLEIIFPELTATKRVTANAFHHLGLFEHSLEAVTQLEKTFPSLPQWAQLHTENELSAGVTRLAATKIATLLHDIGKPDTWTITQEGRHKFYGHDKLGADMTYLIAERLKWSKSVERFITKLVRWHLRPSQLFHHGVPTARALHRFYRSCEDDVPELILLALSDFGATRGPALMGDQRDHLQQKLFELFEGYNSFKEQQSQRIRLLNGEEVIKLLGVRPGPVVGEILQALDEAQAVNEIHDRFEAQRFVVNFYHQKYGK